MPVRGAVLVAALVAAADPRPAAAQGSDDRIDLTSWPRRDLYDGWTVGQLYETPVRGRSGEVLGEIGNVIIGQDGRIRKVVIEAGGPLGIGGTHLAVPWNQVEIEGDLEEVRLPVTAETVEDYSVFKGTEVGAWRASDLLDDYVSLEDFAGYGVVQDLVFGRDGEIQAVVIYPDVGYGLGPTYMYPWYGVEHGFDPAADTYELPYTRDEIEALGPFDYEAFRAPPPGARFEDDPLTNQPE